MRRVAAPLTFALAACAGAPRAAVPTPTPTTVLRITVVYPKTTDVAPARDSAFLFGSVGARLASDDGQWRYARGLLPGIEEFLRQRAAP